MVYIAWLGFELLVALPGSCRLTGRTGTLGMLFGIGTPVVLVVGVVSVMD